MSERATILQQLHDVKQVQEGVWDMFGQVRGMGEVISTALYFYPSMRFPTTISYNASIKMTNGQTIHIGEVLRRWQEDTTVVCLRFQLGKMNLDLVWDNNIAVAPVGELVK